jgi:DNA-directed RNA polymerase subunit E'/Rpb7
MDNIFVRVQLCEKIKLEPAFISKSYKDEVLRRLKVKVEGICTKHGYIKPDSIEIHKICTGRVELIGLNGNTVFDVYFFADVCNPLLGSIIKCQVSNINKFGILAEAGNIIEAIIAKNSVSIQSDVDLERVRIGDEVFIEVLGKKYELNDKKISLIARIVRSPDAIRPTASTSSSKRPVYDEDDEEQEQEARLIEGGADNSDEDSEEEASDEEEDDDEQSDNDSDDDENEDDADNNLEDEQGDVDTVGGADNVSDKDGNFFSDEDDDYFKSGSEYNSDAGEQSDASDVSDDE